MEILGTIITVVVLPILTILTKVIVDAIKRWSEKQESVILQNTINKTSDVISQAVIDVMKQYVEKAKKEGKFGVEEKQKAMEGAITSINAMLSTGDKDLLTKQFGNIELWLRTKIEKEVFNLGGKND